MSNKERLEMTGKTQEEDKAEQVRKIQLKLPSLEYEHILDIADNMWWGAKKFYDPTKEYVLPKDKYENIMRNYPELLV